MTILLIAAAVAALAVFGILAWRRHAVARARFVSLVFLLRNPRPLSENTLRNTLSEALNISFPLHDDEAENFLIEVPAPPVNGVPTGRVKCFMLRIRERMFTINNFAVPYMPDREAAIAGTVDGRLQRAILTHNAWLSMDLMGEEAYENEGEEVRARDAAYATIGKAMAALAGPDCLAVYCPELDRCNEYDASLLDGLRSGDPLTIFDDTTFAPVLHMPGDDPRMLAAIEEARRRWPEFVEAFGAGPEGEAPFLVKAKFEEGDTVEHMWVSVHAIEGDMVRGILENTPNALKGVHAGEVVDLEAGEISDWIYPRGDESVGGFTQDVIAEYYGN